MEPAGNPYESCGAGSPIRVAGRQGGFSLVEILLALFLFVLLVTGVSRTMANARRVQQGSYYLEQASAFAQGKMYQLAAASLATVAPGADTVDTPLGRKFFRSWEVSDRAGSRHVEVTVKWILAGKEHAVKLGTLVR